MRVLLVTVLLQQALLQVLAVTYTSSISSGTVLNFGDRLQSLDGNSYFTIGPSKKLVRLFGSQVGRYKIPSTCGTISSFYLNSNGNLQMVCTTGTSIVNLANSVAGTYRLNIDDNSVVTVTNSAGTVVFDAGIDKTKRPAKYQRIVPDERESLGNNYKYYVIDSVSRGLSIETELGLNHVDYMSGVLLSFSASSEITVDGIGTTGKNFTERDFVQAVQRFWNNATMTGSNYQIISFSGAFRAENSDVVDCAIQWAFKSGFYFVGAAGNSNQKRDKYNPYMMRVGGAYFDLNSATPTVASAWTYSNYGKAINIWASASMAFRDVNGTSISAAAVARGIEAMLAQRPELDGNPKLGFPSYWKYKTSATYLNSADPKVVASPNSFNRVDNCANVAIDPTTVTAINPTQDFCLPLGLSSTPSAAGWTNLVAKASTTVYGDFVTTGGGFTCGTCTGQFCRC